MKLVEAGRLRLDQPITKFLPSYRAVQPPVPTIRNLLLQNSGLPEWNELPEMQNVDSGDATRFELSRMIDLIARQSQLYRPGDWWSYSNSNYTVLAAVIERVSGVSYDEYLARTFFEPLGHAPLDSVVKDIARQLMRLPRPALQDLPIVSQEAERVAGNYDDGMFKFRVFRAGVQLFLDVPQFGTPTRLFYQGSHDFATARPQDFRLRFEPDTGAAQRVVWEWAELRAYGRRVR
jgi:hypothetical protein